MAAAYSLSGWWIMLLSCMIIIGDNNEVFGCLEEEKIALLKLKDVINHQNGSVPYTGSDEEPDCCAWNRITCDVFSKKIVNLEFLPFKEVLDTQGIDKWFMDASLFQPFQELQNLTFQYGMLQGLKGQLKLRKLQVLDLSQNRLSHFPLLLGELPSLKFLDLSYNAISQGFEGLCALTNLRELDLKANELEIIPTCLSNLSSLRLLELSENQFSGTIPSNVFSSLKSLEYVSLSKNHFDGLFSFSSLADNSKLEVFELESYNPKLKVDTSNAQWKHPIFQLKILILSNCIVNELSEGIISSFLLSQYDLRIVDLSNNGMTGELPSWLLVNNSRLEFLSLRNNKFTGRITLQLDSFNAYLVKLDISMNQVAGEIPTFIGSILPSLDYLNMSTNAIEGSIPSSIENMSQLSILDLSDNRLSGEIPRDLYNGFELYYMNLSNNKLGGNIFPKNMSKISIMLQYLYLDSNNFSGDLTYGRLETLQLSQSSMRYLDISNNSISGRFPDWISGLHYLIVLIMSKNHFEGKLPASFCNLTDFLTFIDLSWNNFSDTLPPCTKLSSVNFLHLQGNRFHGQLPTSLSRSSLMTLDVRDNNFSGLIPSWISSLSGLRILLLKNNIFHGSIPSELCQMKNLNILDLSANNLSGSIPPCLFNTPFGKNQLLDLEFGITDASYPQIYLSYSYKNQLHISLHLHAYYKIVDVHEEVQLTTKSMSQSYKGFILNLMSGIDLSHNQLTGPIPPHISNWDMVYSLNLSYNHFNGSIPWNLSRLKALESLDLSHNMLSGEIPSLLTELNFLSVFSVAYNNLSGPTPTTTRQFATFNSSSYEGNPLLCGFPLDRSCNGRSLPPQHAKPSTQQEQNDFSFKTTFLWSFFGSFVVSCIGAFVFFYFNTNVPEIFLGWIGVERIPRWRTVELPWK